MYIPTTSVKHTETNTHNDKIGCNIKTVFIYKNVISKRDPSEGNIVILLYKKLEKQSHRHKTIKHIQLLLRKEELRTKLFTFMQL